MEFTTEGSRLAAESGSAASSSRVQAGRVVSRHARRFQMSLTVLLDTPKRKASSRANLTHGMRVPACGQRGGRTS
eukprot:3468768-Rhodomonas_salina.2